MAKGRSLLNALAAHEHKLSLHENKLSCHEHEFPCHEDKLAPHEKKITKHEISPKGSGNGLGTVVVDPQCSLG